MRKDNKIDIYDISIEIISDEGKKSGQLNKKEEKERYEALEAKINNNSSYQIEGTYSDTKKQMYNKYSGLRNLFFGEEASYLKPLVPFSVEGESFFIKDKNSIPIFSYSLILDFIRIRIERFSGLIKKGDNSFIEKIELSSYIKEIIPDDSELFFKRDKLPTFQLLDIHSNNWKNNLPSKFKTSQILNLLLNDFYKSKLSLSDINFGEKYSYKEIGLLNKENKIINLSTLTKCFVNSSSKRAVIFRDKKSVKEEKITIPTLKVATMAAVALVAAGELIKELHKEENSLWNLYLKVKLETDNKNKGKDSEKRSKKTHEVIFNVANIFRKASFTLELFSSYPVSSPVAGLTIRTFNQITGAEEMTKALEEKLENCYRLYQLYQQYYSFSMIEKIEQEE